MTYINRDLSLLVLAMAFSAGCGDNLAKTQGASITATIWGDSNSDGFVSDEELPLEAMTAYIDANANGVLDEGELTATSDAAGKARFSGLEEGEYSVRLDLPFGWRGGMAIASRKGSYADAQSPYKAGKKVAHIIGGTDAEQKSYPFMVSIGDYFDEEYSHFCGGVLISDRFVLTAAHCSEEYELENVRVMLGTNDWRNEGHQVAVKNITVHPEWLEEVREGHDMALWELSERVDLNALGLNTVQMLTPDTRELASATRLATTIGWGVSDNDSELLQEVHVPVATEESCAIAYPDVTSFDSQICAGLLAGGLDSCQGDSGGPLLVRDPESQRWMHAGITSWGEGCALEGLPGIYGRTSNMSTWAKSQIRESSQAYVVSISSRDIDLSFPLLATTRVTEPEQVPGRWAVSPLSFLGAEDGVVEANRTFGLSFFLFEDKAISQEPFQCEVDMDGDGSIEAVEHSCKAGVNQILLAGYPDGAYQLRVSVSQGGQTRTTEQLIKAGTLELEEVQGALSYSDASDADYPGLYYIDYYEISDAEVGRPSLISVSAAFSLHLGLYDADVRSLEDGGGRLELVTTGSDASLDFVPEQGRRYLLGISSQGTRTVGDYTIQLRNNGTPLPTNLE